MAKRPMRVKRNLKRLDAYNNQRATQAPDGKSQLSLDQGSVEYKAYVEDKERNAPAAPADESHEKLETHNVEIRAAMEEEVSDVRGDEALDIAGGKHHRQRQREGQILELRDAAIKAAYRTPHTLEDDMQARKISSDTRTVVGRKLPKLDLEEEVVINDGVGLEGLEKPRMQRELMERLDIPDWDKDREEQKKSEGFEFG